MSVYLNIIVLKLQKIIYLNKLAKLKLRVYFIWKIFLQEKIFLEEFNLLLYFKHKRFLVKLHY